MVRCPLETSEDSQIPHRKPCRRQHREYLSWHNHLHRGMERGFSHLEAVTGKWSRN
jgi:hypothetical protein